VVLFNQEFPGSTRLTETLENLLQESHIEIDKQTALMGSIYNSYHNKAFYDCRENCILVIRY